MKPTTLSEIDAILNGEEAKAVESAVPASQFSVKSAKREGNGSGTNSWC